MHAMFVQIRALLHSIIFSDRKKCTISLCHNTHLEFCHKLQYPLQTSANFDNIILYANLYKSTID
jgi:hypothetical protein